MFVNFIRNKYDNKLCDSCKKQISMKRFFILRFTISNAETILEMVDRFFNIYTDFVGVFPFL